MNALIRVTLALAAVVVCPLVLGQPVQLPPQAAQAHASAGLARMQTLVEMMKQRGIEARQVSVPGSNPVVFGEIRTAGATRTLGFYAHYDGASLDPREWTTPPFEPALRDKAIEDGGKVVPIPAAGSPFSGKEAARIRRMLKAVPKWAATIRAATAA